MHLWCGAGISKDHCIAYLLLHHHHSPDRVNEPVNWLLTFNWLHQNVHKSQKQWRGIDKPFTSTKRQPSMRMLAPSHKSMEKYINRRAQKGQNILWIHLRCRLACNQKSWLLHCTHMRGEANKFCTHKDLTSSRHCRTAGVIQEGSSLLPSLLWWALSLWQWQFRQTRQTRMIHLHPLLAEHPPPTTTSAVHRSPEILQDCLL